MAKKELKAIVIQRCFSAWHGRQMAGKRAAKRGADKRRAALVERVTRTIQRVSRGRIGRKRAAVRRWEIANAKMRWLSARNIQRTYRGLLGRRRFAVYLAARLFRLQTKSATNIQRIFRGYRGKLLAAVARALRILRRRKNDAACTLQRYMRGCLARMHVVHYRDLMRKTNKNNKSALVLQRIYRGHKGREARAIEQELRKFEGKSQPLIDLIQRLEEESMQSAKTIARLDDICKRSEDELFIIERELFQCMQTTSKYTDSSRINNTPQRFITKYLRVRLKDHFEHEKVWFAFIYFSFFFFF